jgi:hydrogenase 3 maturation protease
MSNLLINSIRENIETALSDKAVIITVGNRLRSDDGAGSLVFDNIKHLASENLKIIDAEQNPENFIEDILEYKPKFAALIDAANFGKPPGTMEIVSDEDIRQSTYSTHSIPLSVVTRLLREEGNIQTILIGIQFKSIDYDQNMSPEVTASAKELADFISSIIKK